MIGGEESLPTSGGRKITAEAERPSASNRLAVGASVSVVGTFAGRILQVVGHIAMARLLGTEAFGLYAIGWTILRLVYVVSGLGLDRAVIRYAAKYRVEGAEDFPRLKGLLRQTSQLSLLSGIIIGATLFVIAPWLAEDVFRKPELTGVIRWFVPALVIVANMKVSVAATTVSQKMIYSVYSEKLTQPAICVVLFFLFYWTGFGLLGAVAATSVSFVAAFLVARYFVGRLFPAVLGRQVRPVGISREVLTFSVLASAAGMIGVFNVWVDRLMVGYFLPASQGGIYQAATESSILFAAIIGSFGSIFSPMIADLHNRGELRELNNLFKVSTKWGLYLSIPPFLVMILMSGQFMTVLFGEAYAGGAFPLVILAAGQIVNVASGAVGLLLVMTGHQKRWFWISICVLVFNVAMSMLMIPRFGLPGAAATTAVSLVVLFGAGLFEVRRHLGLWPYDLRYVKGAVATLAASGAVLLVLIPDIDSAFLELAAGSVMSLVAFAGVLTLLGLDEEDRKFIGLVVGKFGRVFRRRRTGGTA